MVHGVFDPQYQGYGEKFLVRSYLKVLSVIQQFSMTACYCLQASTWALDVGNFLNNYPRSLGRWYLFWKKPNLMAIK